MADPSTLAQSSAARSAAQPDPLLGRVVNDRFKILSVLARGGMGKVYKAEQAPLGRVCALKVLNPNYQGDNDPEFHKRFFLEASVASRLHHPNTVTIFDYGQTTDGIYFMAMEYLEGRTLHRLIRDAAPLDPARALHILLQTSRSLREAHGLGVIHRDLKPANVFLIHHDDDPDYVKVLDFGLVKNVDEANAGENLTQTGLFMGSPKYMAPEQIRGERVSAATDIYALGVILYEMLSGKVPFDRPNSVNVLMAHVSEPVPSMTSMNPAAQVPAVLEDIVYRCLAKHPEERFASMDEFIAVLKHAGQTLGAGVPGSTGTGEFANSLAPIRITSSGENSVAAPILATSPPSPSQLLSPSAPPIAAVAEAPPLPVATPAEFTRPAPAPPPPRRALMAGLGLVVFVLAIGVGLAIHAATTPAPHPVTPVSHETPAVPTPRPSPAMHLALALDSDPGGAEVLEHDAVIGHTPLREEWTGQRGDPGVPHTFTLHLDGFQDATLTLQGPVLAQSVHLQPMTQALTPHPAVPPHPAVDHRPRPGVHPGVHPGAGPVPAGYRRDPYGDEH